MKNLIVLVSAVSLIALSTTTAHAQFGGLLSGGLLSAGLPGDGKTKSKANVGDVDALLKTADEADSLIRRSSDALFKAVASKDELDAHAEKIKAANEIADPKEKEAALKKASDDEQAQLAKVDFAAKSEEAKKTLDAKQKAQMGAAIYNFNLGMLKDMELLERGQSVIESIFENPMAMTKLTRLKDVMSSVSSQMGNFTTIASGLQKMSSVVKLEALPTKSSDQPKPMSD